jgi:tRNA threonylcarbamoyladenosine biosynthesis protein TsaE
MLKISSPEAMEDLGLRIAGMLREGDVICLTGDLGAGKTTLSRGIGAGLKVRGQVTSPTFVVARTHPRDGAPLVHVDAYRLDNRAELEDLDIDWANSIVLVEWGHGMLDTLCESWLEIIIDRSAEADEDERTVTFHAVGDRGNELAEALRVGAK